MVTITIKPHYDAETLASMAVPGLPSTRAAIFKKAKAEGWKYIEVPGKGGRGGVRREYTPPPHIVEAIQLKAAAAIVATAPKGPVATRATRQEAGAVTDRQQLVADARKGILTALQTMMANSGFSLKAAVRTLLDMAARNDVPPHIANMLRLARDSRGRQSTTGLPSVSSLLRLVDYDRAGSLAPRYQARDMSVPSWAPTFMECYQRPEKPTVAHAYRQFCDLANDRGFNALPSIHQVHRFLGKVGKVSLQVGRMGDRELKSIKGFIRRDFSSLLPTDIYSADGHCFDAEVQHPIHGRPFRPEVTSVIDIASRKVVGWSVGLAESALCVLDALRSSCQRGGIPAILYVDNGSGYVNDMMTNEATGLMGRLGIEMTHSIPYNSQARGVIERLHQTLWVAAAKELPGYMGRDMDRQAKHNIFKLTRKAIKGGVTNEPVKMPLIGWPGFLDFCKDKVEAYNNRPHRSLPRIEDPETGKKRHMTPNESWAKAVANGFNAYLVTDEEAQSMFRPQVLRKVLRCEIKLFGNNYYSPQLEEFHGEQMQIAYDIHDPQHVWVHNAEGYLVAVAGLDANKRDYTPKSFKDRASEKRADAAIKRHEGKIHEIKLERDGLPALEQMESITIPGLFKVDRSQLAQRAQDIALVSNVVEQVQIEDVQFKEVPRTPDWEVPKEPLARYNEWLRISTLEEGELTERQKKWRQSYMTTSDFRVFSKKTA